MSRLSFARLDRHCKGYGALVRGPQCFSKFWLGLQIFVMLTKINFDLITALVLVACVYVLNWVALSGRVFVQCSSDLRDIINIRESATMIRRLPDDSQERVGSGDVKPVYIDAFARLGLPLVFGKAPLEGFHRREKTIFAFHCSRRNTVFRMR